MKNGSIDILVPLYNSQTTIQSLIEALRKTFDQEKLQIILVNDGSTDQTKDRCLQLVSKYEGSVSFIDLARNFGEHNAVMAGLNHAKGDYVVIMDDDFQNPPEEALKLFQYAREHQFDVVYSYYRKKNHNIFRNMGSNFTNWIASFLIGKPRDLYLSSFKCLNRFTVQEIIKYKGPFPYIDGLALRCTNRIGKIEVKHEKSQKESSGYNVKRLLSLWFNMFVNFSISPLRLSSILGIIFSMLGVILSIAVVIEKLIRPDIPVGWPFLIIAVMIFSGVQLLILGLIGEYVGRLFLSDNQTPQYVVREIAGKTAC